MSYATCESLGRGDREAILELWRNNLPEASPARYGWLYEFGPATARLLSAPDGRLVGSVGLMRRTFRMFGQTAAAGQAIDLNVDRDHRMAGPALQLGRALTDVVARGELALTYGFPNVSSEPVMRRLGYRAIGNLDRWVRPLSLRALLSRYGWPKPLARGLALLADPIFRLRSPERSFHLPAGLRVESTARFDGRFDRLWEAASPQWPILGERSSAYLHWRFSRCPAVRHRVVCLMDGRNEMLAYLVWSRSKAVVSINDFLFLDSADFEALLAEFLRFMRREGADAVATVHFGRPQIGAMLAQMGFWQRPSRWRAMIYPSAPLDGEDDRRLQPENWHITRADVDTDE
jgi:hypothetical protein